MDSQNQMQIDLLKQIQINYGNGYENLSLLRDWIGQVYKVSRHQQTYIVKVFRSQYTKQAIQSAKVMAYLKEKQFPVPEVITTGDGNQSITYHGQVVIVYEFIAGEEVEREGNLSAIGKQCGWMRTLMKDYLGEVAAHGYEFFINRYLNVMKAKEYKGLDKFTKLGNMLWDKVKDLPLGFLHGDMHTGNMFYRKNELVFYDFDACAIGSPMYDIATVCDATDYFDLSEKNFKQGLVRTKQNVNEFLSGYESYCKLSNEEKSAIYYFIAIRHFDIQATIIESQGLNCVDDQFLDAQYEWLESWIREIDPYF